MTVKNKLSTIWQKLRMIVKNVATYIKQSPQMQFVVLGVVMIVIGRIVFAGPAATNINFLAEIMIITVVALGLNLLLGFSGLVSLATAAFMGVATNSMFVFINVVGLPFLLSVVLTLVLAGFLGMAVGVLSLKMEGIYLAIATLFVGHIVTEIFRAFAIFNSGETQRIGSSIDFFMGYELTNFLKADRIILYYFVAIGMVIAFIVVYNIVKSPTGRALMAISRSQHAALAMGISVIKYRLMAFVIATVFAAFGGILHLIFFQTTGSATKWGLGLSLVILAVVVIGGMKSLIGMLVGAFLLIGVPAFVLREVPILSGFEDILAGLLIVVVILYYPYGAAQILTDIKKLLIRSKSYLAKKAGERRG